MTSREYTWAGLLLAATLAAGTPIPCEAQARLNPFLPDTTLSPPNTPRLIRLPSPDAPLVALRLSIPIVEEPADAGAGRILQTLALERIRSLAGPANARIEGTRTPWGVAYTVVGSITDVDYLAYLLRQAVAEPLEIDLDFRQARDGMLMSLERLTETPGGRIASLLRDRVAPTIPPLNGSRASLTTLTSTRIRDLWARTHQADKMTLVASGDVPVEVLIVSFQGIGAPSTVDDVVAPPPPTLPDRARPEVIRHWYGEARPFQDPRDPHAEVAALLVAEESRRSRGNYEAEVQVWETASGKFLAAVGAAYSRQANAMRQGIRELIPQTEVSLTEDRVRRAVDQIREELLLGARTPGGRVTLVGRHVDAAGEAQAVDRYLRALSAVSLDSTQSFLRVLAGAQVVQAEVRP